MPIFPRVRIKFFLIAGHMIECFDNTLYGFFAVALAPLFFPSFSPQAALLSSYGAFLAGFIARPLGAFFFGHMGDTSGRRRSLLYSMALVGFPTALIGLLPTYENLGLLAPFVLVGCRLLQGFLIGGEFTGANLYISENFVPGTVGQGTGMLISSGTIGAIAATLFGAFVSQDFMPVWGWRIPFIFGGLSAFLIFILRRRMPETDDFVKAQQETGNLNSPWKILLKNHKLHILTSSFISGLTIVSLYCATILGNRIFKEAGFSTTHSMMLNTFGMIIAVFSLLAFGTLADKIGFRRQMIMGTTLIALFCIPSFYPLLHSPIYLSGILWFITTLISVGCMINGCAMPYIASYFPTQCRYSGMAFSVTLGHALFGGTTPLVGSYLIDMTRSNFTPVYWVLALSMITLVLILKTGKTEYLR